MEEFGIKFYLRDGSVEYYDPLIKEDLKETEEYYIFPILAYEYEVYKDNVVKFEWFGLCPNCGYELYDEGCIKYGCSNNKN